jgi:hypothetical protein
MSETIIKTFHTTTSYADCYHTQSSINVELTNCGNININCKVFEGGNFARQYTHSEKITDEIEIPKEYYNVIQEAINGFGGEYRYYQSVTGPFKKMLKELKLAIKNQINHEQQSQNKINELQNEINKLKEQIATYEKIKQVTINNNPQLEKYYDFNIDNIIREENEQNYAKQLVKDKLNDYKFKRAIA